MEQPSCSLTSSGSGPAELIFEDLLAADRTDHLSRHAWLGTPEHITGSWDDLPRYKNIEYIY